VDTVFTCDIVGTGNDMNALVELPKVVAIFGGRPLGFKKLGFSSESCNGGSLEIKGI
jgi:hypothetical protein